MFPAHPSRSRSKSRALAFAKGSGTLSPPITSSTQGRGVNPASSVFDRSSNGLPILLNAPRPQVLSNDPGPAFCGTHILSRPPSAGSSENQPPPLPNREQTSPSQNELGFYNRLARLNPDMKVFVKFHGGTSLRNKESVLALIEKWNKEHREKLIQVERNGGKKSGVVRVICGICNNKKEYPTIQKAAEHITSEHWVLSIWECGECRKSYRRKQELQAHRKKHDKETAMQPDGTPPSQAKPIRGPTSTTLSKPQARSQDPRNRYFQPTNRATTSSPPLLAPPASAQGGRSTNQQSSTRRQEPYLNHGQTTHLRNGRFNPNPIGAHRHSLPSVPPSIPLEHPLLPEMSSSHHPAYGVLSRQVPRGTIGGYSRDYYHSVPTAAPATLMASINRGNLGGNMMHATIPQPRAQYSASHYPVPRPMVSHFQQTQQNMEHQGPLLQYGGPVSHDPRQRPCTSNMPPPLDVGHTYHAYPRDAGQPSTTGMGLPSPQYGNVSDNHMNGYSSLSVPPPTLSAYPQAPEMVSPHHLSHGPSEHITRLAMGYHSSITATAPAPGISYWRGLGNAYDFGGSTAPATIPSLVQHPASVNPPTVSHFQQTRQNMQPQGTSLQYDVPVSYDPQQRYKSHSPIVVVPTSPPLHVPNMSSSYAYIQDAGQPDTMGMVSFQYVNPSVNYKDGYPQQGLY